MQNGRKQAREEETVANIVDPGEARREWQNNQAMERMRRLVCPSPTHQAEPTHGAINSVEKENWKTSCLPQRERLYAEKEMCTLPAIALPTV